MLKLVNLKGCIDSTEQENYAIISSEPLIPILILLRNSTSGTVKLPGNHTSKLPVDVIHYLLHFYCELREEYHFNRAVRVTRGISHIPLLGLLLDSIDLAMGLGVKVHHSMSGFFLAGNKLYKLEDRSTRRITRMSNNAVINVVADHVLSSDEAEDYADKFNYFGHIYKLAAQEKRAQLRALRALLDKVTLSAFVPEAPSIILMSKYFLEVVFKLIITIGILTAIGINLNIIPNIFSGAAADVKTDVIPGFRSGYNTSRHY